MLGQVSGMAAARSECDGMNSRLGTGDELTLGSALIGELQDL